VDPDALEEIPLFAGLTVDQRESLARACEEVAIEAGTTLVREGDFGYAAFAIREGTADVFVDEAVVRTLGPGDMFGEIAILSGGRRTATVVATSPMNVVTVLNRDMWRLERESPEIAEALRSVISERLGATPA
jgi:CRP-like cAMP-binding protein